MSEYTIAGAGDEEEEEYMIAGDEEEAIYDVM